MTDQIPRNPEAERAVLGGVIADPDRLADLDTVLEAADFYAETHRNLYTLITSMHDRGDPVETVSVTMAVAAQARPEDYGGVSYVASLADHIPSTANLRYYAQQVNEAAECRRVLTRCQEAMELARAGKATDAKDVLLGADEQGSARDGVQHMGQVFGHLISTEIPERMDAQENGRRIGLPVPYRGLSEMVTARRGNLIIVAARPAMGKSALVTEWCRYAANEGHGSVQVNLEMTSEEVADRMLAPAAGVPFWRVDKGRLDRDELARCTQAAERMAAQPLYIVDTPALTVEAIRRKCRRVVQQDPRVSIIAVDYLQLIGATDRKAMRQEQIAHASRSLKAMAKELGVLVIALAQLNRDVEKRADKHPTMADLRESGQIEQDADVIMFLMRPGYYDETDTTDEVHLDVGKQRKGKTGRVVLRFCPDETWFADIDQPSSAPPWQR